MADAEIEAACAALTRAVEETVIELVTEIVAILQETTPFLTGHARANWVPNIARPFTSQDGTVRVTKKRGAFTTAGRRQAEGLAKVLGYKLGQGDVFITNNVPYIVFLNYGTSDQAPANFVEAAVERAIFVVESRNGIRVGADFGGS